MLQVGLPNNWVDISHENPNGPPTYVNQYHDEPGVLQISYAEYRSGTIPNPKHGDLIELSKNTGFKQDFGNLQNTDSGDCAFGIYGFAQFSNQKFPYISVWHLSNGQDFVFATFICTEMPDKDEISDVKLILTSIKKSK